jgi:hypothetical protein
MRGVSVWTILALLATVAAGTLAWTTRYRYSHLPDGVIERIDRWTGRVERGLGVGSAWVCVAGCPQRPPLDPQEAAKQQAAEEAAHRIDPRKIDLRNTTLDRDGQFSADLYNGSEATLSELTVKLVICGWEPAPKLPDLPKDADLDAILDRTTNQGSGDWAVVLARPYRIAVLARPLSATFVSTHLGIVWDPDTMKSWHVTIERAGSLGIP